MLVVLVTALATLFIQLGYFLWKLSADRSDKSVDANAGLVVKSVITNWRWLLGTCSTSLGWVLFVYATSLGDISLVQPLMSAGDFILVLLAVLFLKEHLSRWEWAGVLLTIVGAIALAWDPRVAESASYDRLPFWILIGVTVGLALVLFLANRRSKSSEVLLAPIVGLSFGLGAVLTKVLTSNRVEAGESIFNLSILIDPFLISVILANAIGLILLQVAFRHGRASVIVPIQLAMANAVTVIAGIAVFNETITLSRWLGILLIVVGTVFLNLKPRQ